MSVDSTLRKAAKLAKQGNRAGAAQLYREVLAKFPANTAARQGLAALSGPAAKAPARRPGPPPAQARRAPPAPGPSPQQMQALERLLKRGDVASVIAEGQRLALLFPKAPTLLNILGLAQSRAGKYEAAIETFDRLIGVAPDFAGAHANKASAFVKLGRQEETIAAARAAIALNPDIGQAHMFLGYGLLNTGEAEAALIAFRDALRCAPNLPQAHLGLGNTLSMLQRHNEALDAFEAARALDPSSVDISNNIGNALVELDRVSEAVAAFAVAVEADPDNCAFLSNYARALRDSGKNDEAIEALDKAIAIAPDDLELVGQRAQIRPLPLDHPDLLKLEKAVADEATPPAHIVEFEFALFQAYDKGGEAETAFRHLERGNALRRINEPYDINAVREMFKTLKAQFAEPVAPLDEAAMAEVPLPQRPVFIVGMPRSGTTLMEQILASHSQVHGAGELSAFGNAMRKLGWTKPEGGAKPNRKTLLSLRRSYGEALADLHAESSVVTDKTPLNFRWLGHILCAMPEARILYTQRDARAVCWSNYSHSFRGRANNFGHDMEDTAEMFRMHLELRQFWIERFPDQITIAPYEKLTENQEEESRKLVAAAGLDWEEACLEFHKSKRTVHTASRDQVRKKMYKGSSEAWRRYETFLEPMLTALDGL